MADDPRAADAGTADGDERTRAPAEIEADIEVTREELGETVAALAEKADVKARAKETAEQAKARARQRAAEAGDAAKHVVETAPERAGAAGGWAAATVRENPAFAAGVAIALAVPLIVVLRRRR